MTTDDDILDDRFHFCALKAYLETATAQRGEPCPETTRKRAYQLYEESLAAKNASSSMS